MQALGGHRHRGQQRGDQPRQPGDAPHRRRLGCGDRDRPHRRVSHLPRRAPPDAAPALRSHRQCLEHRRCHRQRRPVQLLGREGGADRADQVAGARGRKPRHHRQRGRPGFHRDGDDHRRSATPSAPRRSRRSPRAGWAPPRRSPQRSPSSSCQSPATSPVTCSMSTEVSRHERDRQHRPTPTTRTEQASSTAPRGRLRGDPPASDAIVSPQTDAAPAATNTQGNPDARPNLRPVQGDRRRSTRRGDRAGDAGGVVRGGPERGLPRPGGADHGVRGGVPDGDLRRGRGEDRDGGPGLGLHPGEGGGERPSHRAAPAGSAGTAGAGSQSRRRRRSGRPSSSVCATSRSVSASSSANRSCFARR